MPNQIVVSRESFWTFSTFIRSDSPVTVLVVLPGEVSSEQLAANCTGVAAFRTWLCRGVEGVRKVTHVWMESSEVPEICQLAVN